MADATRRLLQRTVLIGALAAVLIVFGYGILQAEVDDSTLRWGVFLLTSTALLGIAGIGTVVLRGIMTDATLSRSGARLGESRQVQALTQRLDELQRSNEELEQFAYVASHDLQEPLRMVASYLRLLRSEHDDELDEETEEYIQSALDGTDRMSRLIQGLLKYARVGSRADRMEPMDLDDALDQALENLSLAIDETGAVIERGDLPKVKGDVTQLAQVFQNLVSNAIKFRKENQAPQIKIYAEGEPDGWLIHVEDDGIGFDPNEKEDMFQIFQRISSGDERAGTGVGLAVCKRIINRHGGEIDATGEPGKGAAFLIHLPPLSMQELAEGEEETIAHRSQELV